MYRVAWVVKCISINRYLTPIIETSLGFVLETQQHMTQAHPVLYSVVAGSSVAVDFHASCHRFFSQYQLHSRRDVQVAGRHALQPSRCQRCLVDSISGHRQNEGYNGPQIAHLKGYIDVSYRRQETLPSRQVKETMSKFNPLEHLIKALETVTATANEPDITQAQAQANVQVQTSAQAPAPTPAARYVAGGPTFIEVAVPCATQQQLLTGFTFTGALRAPADPVRTQRALNKTPCPSRPLEDFEAAPSMTECGLECHFSVGQRN
ncbi:hypothetical protein NEUTE2DRAFT_124997 [Neurospora tetrasperma FGSC 2509]|nr:hypothetical protein NEUTE2DRAFT_124997 [Neurospora tetrasperma FGSC 2509]